MAPLALKFTRLVPDPGEDCECAVIGVSNRRYIRIMAREPEMDESLYSSRVERAAARWGCEESAIQKVPQRH